MASLRQRVPAEERQRALAGLAERVRVQLADLAGAVDLREGAIDEPAEVLVAAREYERQRLVRKQAIEHVDIASVAFGRVEQDGALAEQDIRPSIDQPLDAAAIAIDGRHRGDNVQLLHPA